ncbi:leukocyte receptor cluster member 1 homolog [Chenopodium quinoa]|uniref:leukocyte receptor cluster member 1 homolog n=1 Tax=Chenopodium quinoa TaxID=63459 RepID=UPI000B774A0F|nr:leukocyte receptor cluster member 1 homolog [Chenopodium quinoa]
MGGHGGLNILPQKKWNVYNFDNREKVRKDEEAAARDEQLKRDQSRKRDSEFRLLQLRRARGVDPHSEAAEPLKLKSESKSEPPVCADEPKSESDSKHINLFDGIKILDPIEVVKKVKKEDEEGSKRKKMKKEEVRVVGPEDEVYRLGYGVAGKGVKAPWYTLKPDKEVEEKRKAKSETNDKMMKKTKKTVEELREERLKREKAEKERERALLLNKRPCNDHYPRDRFMRQP